MTGSDRDATATVLLVTTGTDRRVVEAMLLPRLGPGFRASSCAAEDLAVEPGLPGTDVFVVHATDVKGRDAGLSALGATGIERPVVVCAPREVCRAPRAEPTSELATVPIEEFGSPVLGWAVRGAIERHHLVGRRTKAEESLREILADCSDGVLVLDAGGVIRYTNGAAAAMFGKDASGLVGGTLGIPIAEGRSTSIDLVGSRRADLRAVRTTWEGEAAVVAILRDVTEEIRQKEELERLNRELEEANGRLERLASVDVLTNVLNRRGIERAVIEEVARARRTGLPLAAVLVDSDRFKEVNDTYGHDVGDAILREVAERMRRGLRPSDRLGRVGGDEFLLLLPETGEAEARVAAERIRRQVASDPVEHGSVRVWATVSLAVVEVRDESATIADLLARCHDALMTSKRSGRNRVTSAREGEPAPSGGDGAAPRRDVRRELLEGRTIPVTVESIYELGRRREVGSRLRVLSVNVDSWLSPDVLRQCEEDGCLADVDLLCLEASLRAPVVLSPDRWLHVGIFAHTLLEAGEEELMGRLALPPELRVRLELSDREVVKDMSALQTRVRALREFGVSIAMSNVTASRGALESIILLEPEVILLDASSVRGCAEHVGRRRFVSQMVRLGQALETTVVACGITNPSDLEQVRACGVHFGQGPLLSRPRSYPVAPSDASDTSSATAE